MCAIVLPALFSNDMVIQRDITFPVWGCCTPGTEITVTLSFDSKNRCTRADSDGKWQVFIDPVPPGGPFDMEIAANRTKITLSGIYSGDVWIAAGQSNMEMPMLRIRDNYPEEWQESLSGVTVHQFKVPQECDFSGARDDFTGGCWQAVSKETLNDFSGAAWFFAKSIFKKHNIPIGIINTAWGGTPIEAWISRKALASFPAKAAIASIYTDHVLCGDIANTNNAYIQEWESLLIRHDRGFAEEWHKPDTAIAQWNDITLPSDFAETGLANFCGVIWLCRDFDASSDLAAHNSNMWLGTIVDADTVYINGTNMGGITYRYPPRKTTIPAGLLKEGKNRITIRVSCNSGDGGITKGKSFSIFSEAGSIDLAGTWKYRIGMCAPARPEQFFFQRQPGGIYNAMIAPLKKFPVKGVIWYQGESNERNHSEYKSLFNALIQDWRTETGQKNLPFIFAQLPIYGAPEENNARSSWAAIREAQQATLFLPFTGMAATLDAGEWNDLHPLNKKDVGCRLALAADKLVYGGDNTAPGPLICDVKKHQNRLTIRFINCGTGIMCKSSNDCGGGHNSNVVYREHPHVSIISPGGQKQIPVTIEGPDTISIDLSSVENPQTVLYAWANNPLDRQLFNSEGLPVLPFKVAVQDSTSLFGNAARGGEAVQ